MKEQQGKIFVARTQVIKFIIRGFKVLADVIITPGRGDYFGSTALMALVRRRV